MKKRPQREKAKKKIIEITCKIQNIEVVEDFDKYAYSHTFFTFIRKGHDFDAICIRVSGKYC